MTVSGREKKGHQHGRLLLQLEVAWAAACYVALFVLCSLCYSNSLYGELVHDDVWAIVNNPDVRPGSSLRNIFRNDFWGKRMADNTSHKSYRPLCILTFKLNILLGGMTPLYFHIINVCLHCAVTCLLMYTCERCVFENPYLAFITALLFAVHPVHTEAVLPRDFLRRFLPGFLDSRPRDAEDYTHWLSELHHHPNRLISNRSLISPAGSRTAPPFFLPCSNLLVRPPPQHPRLVP